jgi:hypothetical protein
MEGRDELIRLEAAALWRELHGGAEPAPAEFATMLDAITADLPIVPYDRICSPWLRSATITTPKRANDA